jgi:ATP-dependent DNA helicase DinG
VPPKTPADISVGALLDAAVTAVGGSPRAGQQQMAEAVAQAFESGRHLLVQAGTGTGKSLAYLVPAIAHALIHRRPVVISTATLALQSQVVTKDLPVLADALTPLLPRRPTWQLVKGRANYVCRHKLGGGYPAEDDGLFQLSGEPSGARGNAGSSLGRQVVRLRQWAEQTTTGDRDDLASGVTDRAWRQISVSARECLGAQVCPQAADCFCELARHRARDTDIVVTNHAVVAIDAFEGRSLLPEHDLLVLDEAHELADRVTAVVAKELTVSAVEAAARRARAAGAGTTALDDAATVLAAALDGAGAGRLTELDHVLGPAVTAVRDAARDVISALKGDGGGAADGSRQQARAAASEVFGVAEWLGSGSAVRGGPDVMWLSGPPSAPAGGSPGTRSSLHIAPLSVAQPLRERLFSDRTAVLTSATLAVGGGFDATAGVLGLPAAPDQSWIGLDVGSPFDYQRQAILYVARHLAPPGKDGLAPAMLDELAALIEAAGGRTLGLFSSRRAAETAAEQMRERLAVPVLCQGDDATAALVRTFAAEEATCLFGTLSLWQGVDVPGASCQLVVVDRIPFARPDDPLSTARQEAVARAGGNAFMSVAATQAALLLAQGVGRLVRSGADRGVVAVLDSRLATARYAPFLRASLPPFWFTTDRSVVLSALRRIDQPAAGGAQQPAQ